MPVETITFSPRTTATVLGHRVYLRDNWADAWVLEPYLWPLRVQWTSNESIDTAELGTYRYGRLIRPDDKVWELIQRLTGKPRWYVKIEIDADSFDAEGSGSDSGSAAGMLTWYGWIEIDSDQIAGVQIDPDSAAEYLAGNQRFTCYGLESVLYQQRIYQHAWRPEGGGGGYNNCDGAPDFNLDGHGNRATSKSLYCYPFSSRTDGDGDDWSTKDIVEYLLYEGVPRNKAGTQMVPFSLEDPDGLIPDTDAPVVAQEGRRTLEVINELLSSANLLGYRLEVDPATDVVLLKPYTLTATDLVTLERTIPANPVQVNLVTEDDPDVETSVKSSSLAKVDQVIVRGAKRRSVCSLSVTDGNLEAGWDSDLQTEYDEGGSNDPDYPATTEVDERQRRDAEVRSLDRLRNVYSRLQIPAAWDGRSGDGFSGTVDSAVFPADSDSSGSGSGGEEGDPYPLNPRLLRILPSLALLEGTDYETAGTPSPFDLWNPKRELPPAAFAPLPELTGSESDTLWIDLAQNAAAAHVEDTEEGQARTWSVDLSVAGDDRSLALRVQGAPQHALAYETFSPQAHELELQWGQYDYTDFVCLVTLEDQRWAEMRWPSDDFLSGSVDVIRRKYVLLGDGYRLDYLVPDTFVAINQETGAPVLSNGGYIRDDRDKLESIAFATYVYVSVDRRALSMRAHRVVDALHIGDYVVQIGDAVVTAIASVVTSIEISWPEADGPTAGAPEISWETGFAEADAVRL
jgi:hypothetical protein